MREQSNRFLRGVARLNSKQGLTTRVLRRQFIGKSHKERASLKRLGNRSLVDAAAQDPMFLVQASRTNRARVRSALALPERFRGGV